jgi:hypothetical protein
VTAKKKKSEQTLLTLIDFLSQIFIDETPTITGQCYKTFYDRKLRIFVVGYSFCSKQTFPAMPIVCGIRKDLFPE